MRFGLPDAAIGGICEILARFPAVTKAVLYGSRAKGTHKTGSDIDLTLFGDALTSDLLAQIAEAIDDLLLPYTVDLSSYAQLNHIGLKEHIDRVGIIFYQRRGGLGVTPRGRACTRSSPPAPANWPR